MKRATMKKNATLLMIVGLWLSATVASATPVVTTGYPSHLTSIDLSADFDGITTFGQDLTHYTEGGLNAWAVSPSNYGLSFPCLDCAGIVGPTWYVNGGGMYDGYLSISAANAASMSAIEFVLGSGWGYTSPLYVYWETYSGNSLTGSGTLSNLFSGTLMDFADVAGIDELRLGAYITDPNGSFVSATPFRPNAIAIDNLRAQTSHAVPEPATLMLFLFGLMGVARARRSV